MIDVEIPAFPWFERKSAGTETVTLRNVFLHVTKACNMRCTYCYFSASEPLPGELTAQELARSWPELVMLRPEKVIFTGGEPLLRPDLLELLGGLRAADPEHRVLRCLNTNGQLVTPLLARQLVGLADEVRVSLDALPERNDTLRGRGTFAAALHALDCYHAVGFEPKALVTVTSHSLPDLEDLLCLLIDRGMTRVNLNLFRPIGRGRRHTEWLVSQADVRAAVQRAWARCCPDQPPPPQPEPAPCTSCGVGQFLNIMPNGDVFPCHVLTQREFRCGNLREDSLLVICRRSGLLGSLASLDFAELASKDADLAALAQRDVCMGNIYAQTKSSPTWRENLPMPARGQVQDH